MSHSTECPCGRPRAGCDYHDPALQPYTEADADRDYPANPFATEPCESDGWGDPDDPANPFAFHDTESGRPSLSIFFEGELIRVYPEPDATAVDVARLIAAQISGAQVDADGTTTIVRLPS